MAVDVTNAIFHTSFSGLTSPLIQVYMLAFSTPTKHSSSPVDLKMVTATCWALLTVTDTRSVLSTADQRMSLAYCLMLQVNK